jgi:hypothetical protein
MFSVYLKTFPPKDTNLYYKSFYYSISVPKVGKVIRESPATKNEGLFNSYFVKADGPIEMRGRVYYLIASKFCFPAKVLKLFMEDYHSEDMSLHEIFEFNNKNGMLSKYCFVDNEPYDSVGNTLYKEKVVTSFVNSIKNMLGEERITDDRFNERLSVKRLSEFPYVFERLNIAFNRENIEFKDLNVVFISDDGNKNILGGYDCERLRNTETVVLSEDSAPFQLPVIMLNIANVKMQRRENLTGILIHEGKHYLDDMREAKEEKALKESNPDSEEASDFFNIDYKYETDNDKRMEGYLLSKHETSAFAEAALNYLKHYPIDYVYENWVFLKTKIIHEHLAQNDGIDYHNLSQKFLDAFSKIMDKALGLYEAEEQQRDKKVFSPA